MLELGLGARTALAAGGPGVVAATFAKAAYLRLPAGLLALVRPEVPSGPLHVRGAIPIDRLVAGQPVTVVGSRVRVGPVALDLAGATVWEGPLPSPAELAAAAPLALDLLAGAPPSALADPAFRARTARAVSAVHRGDLACAMDALAGLGPGLTPAGDDVLAGVLLVARIRQGRAGEGALVEAARRARTDDVAGAFLSWAARGQSIEPVHRFLTGAAGQDRAGAEGELEALWAVGHTSGADVSFGLRLGLHAFVAPAA